MPRGKQWTEARIEYFMEAWNNAPTRAAAAEALDMGLVTASARATLLRKEGRRLKTFHKNDNAPVRPRQVTERPDEREREIHATATRKASASENERRRRMLMEEAMGILEMVEDAARTTVARAAHIRKKIRDELLVWKG